MASDGPLQWSEIEAYGRITGEIAEPWEAQTVRLMSVEYLSGKALTDGLARPPYDFE